MRISRFGHWTLGELKSNIIIFSEGRRQRINLFPSFVFAIFSGCQFAPSHVSGVHGAQKQCNKGCWHGFFFHLFSTLKTFYFM